MIGSLLHRPRELHAGKNRGKRVNRGKRRLSESVPTKRAPKFFPGNSFSPRVSMYQCFGWRACRAEGTHHAGSVAYW
ncbi:unnamed protein product [Calypogeia fissa]